ncbi:MAG: hypothetical protein ABI595_10045 [Actinomycetota bacterium]
MSLDWHKRFTFEIEEVGPREFGLQAFELGQVVGGEANLVLAPTQILGHRRIAIGWFPGDPEGVLPRHGYDRRAAASFPALTLMVLMAIERTARQGPSPEGASGDIA